MLINLTDKGLEVFGFKPNRRVINVPIDRAYLLMTESIAIKDKGFMTMYEKNNPDIKQKQKPVPKRKPVKKRETAISKKASTGEKAVTE